GHGHAPRGGLGDQPAVLVDLGGQDQDAGDPGTEKAHRLGPVGRADVGGVLGPGLGRVQVGALQVGAEDGGPALDRAGARPHRLQGALGVGTAGGHGGGQPGGDAVAGEEAGHPPQPVGVGVHDLDSDGAVDVQVDEAGQGDQAVGGQQVGAAG